MSQFQDIIQFRIGVTPADIAAIQQQVAGAATAGLAQALRGSGGGAPSSSPQNPSTLAAQLAQIRSVAGGSGPAPASSPAGPAAGRFGAAVSRFVAAVSRFASVSGRGGAAGPSQRAASAASGGPLWPGGPPAIPRDMRARLQAIHRAEQDAARLARQQARNQPPNAIARMLFGPYGSISPVGRMLGLRRGGQLTETLRAMSRGGGRLANGAIGGAIGAVGGGAGGAGAGLLAGAVGGPIGLAVTAAVVGLKLFADTLDAVTARIGKYDPATAQAQARNTVTGIQSDISMAAAMSPMMSSWIDFKSQCLRLLTDIVVIFRPVFQIAGRILDLFSLGIQKLEEWFGVDTQKFQPWAMNHLTGVIQPNRMYDPLAQGRAMKGQFFAEGGIGITPSGSFVGPGGAGNFNARIRGARGPVAAGGGAGPGAIAPWGFNPANHQAPALGNIPGAGAGAIAGGGALVGAPDARRPFPLPAFARLEAFTQQFRHHLTDPGGGAAGPGGWASWPAGEPGNWPKRNKKLLPLPPWQEHAWDRDAGSLAQKDGPQGPLGAVGKVGDILSGMLGHGKAINDIADYFTSMPPLNPELTIEQQFTYQLQNESQVHGAIMAFQAHLDEGMARISDEVKMRLSGMTGGNL